MPASDTNEHLLPLITAALRSYYVRVVGDPGGTPLSENITVEDLLKTGAFGSEVRAVTASGNVTLLNGDPIFIEINPNGADRDVTFPAKSNDNHGYFVHNTGTANRLTLKRSGGGVFGTLSPGEVKYTKPSTASDFSVLEGVAASPNINLLHNGGMRVAQRGAGPFTSASSFVNNDDSYLIDGCVFLANGSDTCDVSQVADNDFVSGYKIRLDVETANRRFGILLPVENKDIQDIRKSGKASVQFKVKCTGTSMSNVRAYLLAWNGTADAITSDVISAWGSAGGDPTFVANWTAENAGANLSISTTIAIKTIENIVVDTSGVTNLALLIIVDDTDATVGDFLEIGDVKLENGAVCTDYVNRPYQEDLDLCLRLLCVLRASDATSNNLLLSNTYNYTTTSARGVLMLPVPMRVQPSMAVITIGNYYIQANGSNFTASAAIIIGGTNQLLWIQVTMATATAGHAGVFGTSTSTEIITFSAEL